MFEQEYEALYRRQLAEARGQRREMLEERDMSGTKKMLEVVFPVIGSLRDVVLEFEMISLSGVRIFGDAFWSPMQTVMEEENFTTHAELVTRRRYNFERARARSVAVWGYAYFPYTRDDLEQQPEMCRRDLQELISMRVSGSGEELLELPVFERETLRFAAMRQLPFKLAELGTWLKVTNEAAGRFARRLVSKGLLMRVGGGEQRCYEFVITDKGRAVLLGKINNRSAMTGGVERAR